MLKVQWIAVVFAAVCVEGVSGAASGTPACADLEGTKPQAQLEYLQRERSTLKPECILFAIDQIGLKRHAPAAQTLVKYLDYRVPEDPAKAHWAVVSRTPTLGAIYPAITALFEIGKPAVSALVEAVADSNTSDHARDNAIEALFEIHRESVSGAVAVLNRASQDSNDRPAAQRLLEAARTMAGKCRGEDINACVNALRD